MKIFFRLVSIFCIVITVVGFDDSVGVRADSNSTACDENHPSQGVHFTCHYFSQSEVSSFNFKPIDKQSGKMRFNGSFGVTEVVLKETGNGAKYEVTISVDSSFNSDSRVGMLLDNGFVALNKKDPSDGKIKMINLTSKPLMWTVISGVTNESVDMHINSEQVLPKTSIASSDLVIEKVCKNRDGKLKWDLFNRSYSDVEDLSYRLSGVGEVGRFDVVSRGRLTLLTENTNSVTFYNQGTLLFSSAVNATNCETFDDSLYEICVKPYYSGGKDSVFPIDDVRIDADVIIEESVYGRSFLINFKRGSGENDIPVAKNVLF